MAIEGQPSHVVVLYNVYDQLTKGEPRDHPAEQGVIACAEAITGALNKSGYEAVRVPLYKDVELALIPYPPTLWTIFNLGEGSGGGLFEEARIAWALDAMGYRFTGCGGDALARSTHKVQAKSLVSAHGVNTPDWWLFRHPSEVDSLTSELPFPLIVKPVADDASLGIGTDAVVHSVEALRHRVTYITECYRQAALAEVFVAGREFNISIWGDPPQILPLAEIDFNGFADPCDCIVSFSAKWEVDSFEYQHTPVLCPAPVGPDLEARIREAVWRAWTAIGCRGYARVDIRVGEDGAPYVIDVNCNPDLSPDAGFYQAVKAAGYCYEEMVVNILENARRTFV